MKKLISISLIFAALSGCGGSGSSVDFIIPDGFRGLFMISPDRQANPIPKINGRYVVHIPSSGHLLVADMAPFRNWHSSTAFFASGKRLPDSILTDNEDEVTLHTLTTDSRGNTLWLVGTLSEKELFYRSNRSDLPLAQALINKDAHHE